MVVVLPLSMLLAGAILRSLTLSPAAAVKLLLPDMPPDRDERRLTRGGVKANAMRPLLLWTSGLPSIQKHGTRLQVASLPKSVWKEGAIHAFLCAF